ncbi:MAG: NAD(P)H-hydrate dehydratase [Candidatus Binataceae bacterium]
MKLLTASESRELDRLSQDKYGVPSYSLMSRAGEAVADLAGARLAANLRAGAIVVAGKGNNGGDAMVAARKLLQEAVPVRAILLAHRIELKGDAARACEEFAGLGGEIAEVTSEPELAGASFRDGAGIVIDGIFGTGLNAEVSGIARRAIEMINGTGAPIVAVDIASGVNSDTGAIMGSAVKASLTVTFGFAKFGHVSYPGAAMCGALEVADIGFAPDAIGNIAPGGCFLERDDVRALLRPRPADSHKGMYGHPLVIAGGLGKSGAAILAARGALRMGAGLVTAAIPESIASVVATGQAELMTEPMPDADGHFDAPGTASRLASLIAGKDALIVGPGIGLSEDSKDLMAWLISEASEPNRPILIDADGLNALAEIGCGTLLRAKGPVVLTPHPGEMARLLGITTARVNADRISAARRLCAETGAYVVLKGNRSVIAARGGAVCVNSSGNPGMGTPGMGDALSGMLGALLGQRMNPLDALKLGVFLHGYAADRVVSRLGPFGYITGDVIDELPRAIAALAT